MKIGVQTWGSHGDIRPFLALAEGLQAAGHQVTLVITCVDSAAFKGIGSEHGVDIRVIGSPVMNEAEQAELGELAVRTRDPMKQLAAILRHCFEPVEEAMFAAARDLSADCDLLIGHYFLYPLQIAAEQAGKPYVSVMLSHGGIPSAFDHPMSVPALGKIGNRVLWWLTRMVINRELLHYPNRLRRQANLPLTKDIIDEVWLSPQLTLVAISEQICPPQPDWPESVKMCGFFDMPNLAVEGKVPDRLAAFLAAGEKPVYMTLGSWMPKDIANQSATLQLLTEGARLAGCRAIIQAPSAQACGVESDARFLYVGAAPHQALFPQCSAVVHHGGAGTTQSATMAGTPSIVIAHISEQELWGRELHRLGIAGRAMKRRSVTAQALAQQIRTVLNTPEMGVRARQAAARMQQENGVASALALIREKFDA